MKIIDKYILNLIIKSSMITLIGIVTLFAFFKFLDELNELDNMNYSIGDIFQYIFLLLPSFFNSFIVLGLLIGSIIAIGQLNSNKEIQIFHTASISHRDLIFKFLKYPFFVSVIFITFFEFFASSSLRLAEVSKNNALGNPIQNSSGDIWLRKSNEISLISSEKKFERVFELENSSSLKKYSIYMPDSIDTIIFDNNRQIIQHESIQNKSKENRTSNSKDHDFLNKNTNTLSIIELIKAIKVSLEGQTNIHDYFIELVFRLIKPLNLLTMLLIALPFIVNNQKSTSIGVRIFIAVSIGIFAHLLTKILSVISIKFPLMQFLGPILPTFLFLIIGLVVFKFKFKLD